jgi:hypothetical protein
MDMVMKVIGQMLHHSSASVLLIRKTTNIIWNRHALLFMDKINQ